MKPAEDKKLEDYERGDKIGGRTIVDIVGRNEKFMVCTVELAQGIGVHWAGADGYSFTDFQRSCFQAFNWRYDVVKQLFGVQRGPVEALAAALYGSLNDADGDAAEAFIEIDQMIELAKTTATNHTRALYGVSALVCSVVLLVIGAGVGSIVEDSAAVATIPIGSLVLAGCCGALGSLSSVLQKLKSIEVSHYPGFKTASFGGITRIILGSIFGAVAVVGAEAGLLLVSVFEQPGGIILIGFLGGVSERLVPDLIQGLESRKALQRYPSIDSGRPTPPIDD